MDARWYNGPSTDDERGPMDAQDIIDQVMDAVQDAPETINDLLADPRGAIERIIGRPLAEDELAEVVEAVQNQLASGELDLSKIDLSAIDLTKIGGLGSLLGAGGLGGFFRN